MVNSGETVFTFEMGYQWKIFLYALSHDASFNSFPHLNFNPSLVGWTTLCILRNELQRFV